MEVQTDQNPAQIEQADIEKNKVMAILAYILFFVPLLAAKESKYVMYHTNQGLLLFLTAVAINFIGAVIPFIGWMIILPVGNIAVFIFAVLGIINAAQGRVKQLPLIGKYQLIK